MRKGTACWLDFHETRRRYECLGGVAEASGRLGAGDAGRARKCQFSSGALFRGDASAGSWITVEFCGVDAGKYPAWTFRFRVDFPDGAAACAVETEGRASAGVGVT